MLADGDSRAESSMEHGTSIGNLRRISSSVDRVFKALDMKGEYGRSVSSRASQGIAYYDANFWR